MANIRRLHGLQILFWLRWTQPLHRWSLLSMDAWGVGMHSDQAWTSWQFQQAVDAFVLQSESTRCADVGESSQIKQLIDWLRQIQSVENIAAAEFNHAQTADPMSVCAALVQSLLDG